VRLQLVTHIWHTLAIAVIAIALAVCVWTVIERRGRDRWGDAGRAPVLVRRATLLAMMSAAGGLAIFHFGIVWFRYFAMSNAFKYAAAFWYTPKHAWPLLFLPWSAWVFRVAVAVLRGDRAARHSTWTGVVHGTASWSFIILAAEGVYLAGFYRRDSLWHSERDFVLPLQCLFVLLTVLGVAAGVMLSFATSRKPGTDPRSSPVAE
jgi:hypothetical protein